MKLQRSTCYVSGCHKVAVRIHTLIEASFGVVFNVDHYDHDGQGYKTDGVVNGDGHGVVLAECEAGHVWKTYAEDMNDA